MKRILATIMALVLCAGAFSGCSGDTGNAASAGSSEAGSVASTDETGDASGEEAALSGELTYWTYTDSTTNLVNEFAKVNPDIKINLQVFGGDEYKTKLLTTIQSGQDIPDLFDLEENYAYEFLPSDAVEDLSARGYDELLADFYPYMVANCTYDGKIKGINFQSSPVGFWYLRDAAKQWLGTDDPDEISAMCGSWEDLKALSEKVIADSNGEVYLLPNTVEFVKIVGFSFEPFVRDGQFSISQEWLDLIDVMRDFRENNLVANLNSWSEEWAAQWNAGKVLFRVMPSWDFFTDWEKNAGNVGIAAPFENAFEGATLICMWSGSEKKELSDEFLKFVVSDDFQRINMESYNQVPASSKVAKEMAAEGFTSEDFGGQNLIDTYDKINSGIEDIVPDKYTRALQNLFQSYAEDGVLAGEDNDTIVAKFKAEVKDKYPEQAVRSGRSAISASVFRRRSRLIFRSCICRCTMRCAPCWKCASLPPGNRRRHKGKRSGSPESGLLKSSSLKSCCCYPQGNILLRRGSLCAVKRGPNEPLR